MRQKQAARGHKLSLAALTATAVIALFATTTVADQPTKVQIIGAVLTDELAAGEVCPFAIQTRGVANATLTVFVDRSGTLKKEQAHVVEQDTFEANGKSLTSVPYTFNITWLYDSDGNLRHFYFDGVVVKVLLPDGSLFISAGRTDAVAHGLPGAILTPDHGGSVNLEGFCAALAP